VQYTGRDDVVGIACKAQEGADLKRVKHERRLIGAAPLAGMTPQGELERGSGERKAPDEGRLDLSEECGRHGLIFPEGASPPTAGPRILRIYILALVPFGSAPTPMICLT
jgi:hypothetical protein